MNASVLMNKAENSVAEKKGVDEFETEIMEIKKFIAYFSEEGQINIEKLNLIFKNIYKQKNRKL